MKTRIVILAAAVAATSLWAASCAQPSAGCPVLTSNPSVGLSPYWVSYTKKSGTGACSQHPGETIGFQKYSAPGAKENVFVYVSDTLGVPFSEGRVDPTDPKGKNLLGYSSLPAEPTDAFCAVPDFTGAPRDGGSPLASPQQAFEATEEEHPLTDGGTEIVKIPALTVKHEVTGMRFIETVNAPGTVFGATIKVTEDSCTATYDAVGLWPAVACDPDANGANGYNLDCDPLPVPDAGHILASGINPTFAPTGKPITCKASGKADPAGYCTIQLSVDEISKL